MLLQYKIFNLVCLYGTRFSEIYSSELKNKESSSRRCLICNKKQQTVSSRLRQLISHPQMIPQQIVWMKFKFPLMKDPEILTSPRSYSSKNLEQIIFKSSHEKNQSCMRFQQSSVPFIFIRIKNHMLSIWSLQKERMNSGRRIIKQVHSQMPFDRAIYDQMCGCCYFS